MIDDECKNSQIIIKLVYLASDPRQGNNSKTSPETILYALKGCYIIIHGEIQEVEEKLDEGCFFYVPANKKYISVNLNEKPVALLIAFKGAVLK
ncbi:hypothetical protein [Kosakonia arachidis]|uniref:hypothetical protein n=1 Tax=Kosakonia arachidis TaxID=551989 RepID=UPI000B7F4467|nr:hypothetical protein [Kosakonia arachidis]